MGFGFLMGAAHPRIVPIPQPATLLAMLDAQNINAANNVGLIDGAAIGTYKNVSPGVGSLGSAADLPAGGSPFIFRKVATLGFLRGLSAVESDGTKFQSVSAPFAAQAQPIMVALVIRPTDLAGTYVWFNGGSSGNELEIATFNASGGEIVLYAGSAPHTGSVMTAGQWHVVVVEFNGASSTIHLDGIAGNAGSPGSHTFDSLELNSEHGAGGTIGKGMHALTMVWGGTVPTPLQAKNYVLSRLGFMPQG